MDSDAARSAFFQRYGTGGGPVRFFFAPGRVNLIGEHTDYTGGLVLPCALTLGTWLAARRVDDQAVSLSSSDEAYSCTLSPEELGERRDEQWVNYPLGVIDQFTGRGLPVSGLELHYAGDLPRRAGLSSSASIEMATAVAVNRLCDHGLSLTELARMARDAEAGFAGLRCGIMDPFASGLGRAGTALFLNCHTLGYRYVPLPLSGFALVIAHTNKPRELVASAYNERFAECAEAERILSDEAGIERLGELGEERFRASAAALPEALRRRVRHVVTENRRVMEAVKALLTADLPGLGRQMNASHDSLRDDFEVTGPELDALVEEAREVEGVLGSRMTGGGFGGCTISLVPETAVETFTSRVGERYRARTKLTASFYVAEPGDGAREIF